MGEFIWENCFRYKRKRAANFEINCSTQLNRCFQLDYFAVSGRNLCFSWILFSYIISKLKREKNKVSSVSFLIYVLSSKHNVLDAQKAFSSLALFNLLKQPLTMLPVTISNVIQVFFIVHIYSISNCNYNWMKKINLKGKGLNYKNNRFFAKWNNWPWLCYAFEFEFK